MKESHFPPGWDEARVQRVLRHYERQSEEEAVAEDEAAFDGKDGAMICAKLSPTRSCTVTGSTRAPNVFVEIYADRIEVSNPGGLPSGMLPSDLGRKSVRRNPLIADLLHRIEYIEKAGTGIRRMREAVREHGSPRSS
jgi:hypothetical protein